jgi:Mg2+ transporter MgtE
MIVAKAAPRTAEKPASGPEGERMIYLSQLLGKPVIDAAGEQIGTINDIAIATGEVFPRVTSLAFVGPDKTPFMLSWRKFVEEFSADSVTLNAPGSDIRFSYLQPDEVLLSRDLLNKQIVDTQGMKVVRVNDLKLSESRNQLRLLGAEVGTRGILRGISPALESIAEKTARLFGSQIPENIIAWNYMDLLDRDLSQVKLSVTHKRLHELHPADVADIMEQLAPSQRAKVFEHFDNESAADTITELEDELQADLIEDLSERRASVLLAEMDPDDAADIIGDLSYDKAERLLRLMGLEDATAIRGLLGYKEKTAGGIMTPEVTTVTEDMTIQQVIEHLRVVSEEQESIYYVYVVEGDRQLVGVVSLRDLLLASPDTVVGTIAERELFTAGPDDDQEDVAEQMSKYDLLALPVVDEHGKLLGIVTVDDALDVLEEESAEDLALAGASADRYGATASMWWRVVRRSSWLLVWAAIVLAAILVLQEIPGGQWTVLMLPALIFMPLLLRTAEEAAQRAIAEMIEGAENEERLPLWREFARDGMVGLVLGAVSGGFAFVAMDLVVGQTGAAAMAATAAGVSVFLVMLASVGVTAVARRRANADKVISGIGFSIAMMLLAGGIYLLVSAGAGMLLMRMNGA